MSKILNAVINKELSRRSFLKLSGVAMAGLALAGGQRSEANLTSNEEELLTSTADTVDAAAGVWKTAPCWHNCGGRCLHKGLLVDGVVVRQKTDDTHEDTPDYPQQRACTRGRAQRQQVYAADRLRYPMKRKNWQPGGETINGELRGIDEWERISWEEAFSMVASEMTRISETYGQRALFATSAGDAGRLMNALGGYISSWGTTSWGSWRWGPDYFGMEDGYAEHSINDRLDIRNSDYVVLFGLNPAWSSPGSPMYHFLQAKKAGAKFIVIDPIYTDTAATLEAQWIPIRPGTDHPMVLALAYTLLDEDDPESNPLIDWDFLQSCTIGFDADSLPEGADKEDNIKDYILGTYDGIPKTPEWASEICGVDPDDIKELAQKLGCKNKVALLTGWAAARIHNSDSWPQMFMTLGAMGGHMGLSGKMTGVSCHFASGNGGPYLVKGGSSGVSTVYGENAVGESIAQGEMWNAILRGSYVAGPDDERDIDIKMIYHAGNAHLQTMPGFHEGVEAHRKMEFVVSHAQFLTVNAQYSDIVLPVTTEYERTGGLLTGNREMLINYGKLIEPLYEAKSDRDAVIGIGKALGLKEEDLYSISETQALFNQLAGSTVITEDGSDYEPLLTITEEDIEEWGVEGTPQDGRITLSEFIEKGIYQVERSEGDPYGYIGYEAFRNDPEGNPLTTESGKLEIYCKTLKEFVDGKGFTTIEPYGSYNKPSEGYEDSFTNWNNKVKGDYPYQVMNPHYMRRSHTVFDNLPVMREAFPNPVFISSSDAGEKGISTGDTVLLESRFGKTLRHACVTDCIRPGVVGVMHGCWPDIDEKTGIDKAGADNTLTGQIVTGQGILAWNSYLVNFEKYTEDELPSDLEMTKGVVIE